MDVYIAPSFTGCTISDKLFTNFIYLNSAEGNGVPVAASSVLVVPDLSNPLNPGFHFVSSAWVVASHTTDTFDSFTDSSIGFTVQTISGLPLIEDNTLTLDIFSATGSAFGDVAETVLPSGQQWGVDTGGPFVDHQTFPPTNILVVSKDLIVAAQGGTESSASITQFSENFSEVGAPEPLTCVLFGTGLVALGALRRRK
jgi:hypothetical protein